MTTHHQLCISYQRKYKRHKVRTTALKGCPQRRGIVLKLLLLSPKKPNSAIRKIARIRLCTGRRIRAGIPGQGHNLQQFSTVMVRGGRVKDVPGISYKLIRGKYDFSTMEKIIRKKGRSRWGLAPLDISKTQSVLKK